MGYNPVDWFEIYVKDIERAKAFYRQCSPYVWRSRRAPLRKSKSCGHSRWREAEPGLQVHWRK